MRMRDRIGTLVPDKLADLVLVDDDPLRDITVLQDRARLSVMQAGRWVTRRLWASRGSFRAHRAVARVVV
jgi:imidazolonepropionase-like amidohydrolase